MSEVLSRTVDISHNDPFQHEMDQRHKFIFEGREDQTLNIRLYHNVNPQYLHHCSILWSSKHLVNLVSWFKSFELQPWYGKYFTTTPKYGVALAVTTLLATRMQPSVEFKSVVDRHVLAACMNIIQRSQSEEDGGSTVCGPLCCAHVSEVEQAEDCVPAVLLCGTNIRPCWSHVGV